MSFQSLIDLDRQLLLWFNGSDSLFIDNLAMTLTNGLTWIPLYVALLYLVIKNNSDIRQILFIIAGTGLCVLLAGTLNDELVKPGIARFRPTRDPIIAHLIDVVDGYRGGRYGFFSSHAANTFSIAMFFSLLVKSRTLSIMLILWSLVNCWTRMYLGVHFPGDILCGLVWGGFVGTAVYFLYKYFSKQMILSNNFISEKYTLTGYSRSDIDIVVCVLGFLYLFALIKACFA